jgi:hemerythrin-like metal-binding protein
VLIAEGMGQFRIMMQEHFESDEAYMERIAYPRLAECREKHQSVLDEIDAFIAKLEVLEVFAFEMALAKSVDKWLVSHIEADNKEMLRWETEQEAKADDSAEA